MPTSHFRSCWRFNPRSSGVLGRGSTLIAIACGKSIPFKARSLSNFYPLERFPKVEFEIKDDKHFFQHSCYILPKALFKNLHHSGRWRHTLWILTVCAFFICEVEYDLCSLGICLCAHVHCLCLYCPFS